MRSFPTRPALDLVVAGSVVVLAGILSFQPVVVAWGGALLLGLCLSRSLTLLSVARVRTAGFEMIWNEPSRTVRLARGQMATIRAEVRNRDSRAIRYAELRVLGSPCLEVDLAPRSGEVPAGGCLPVSVTVLALRVGRHGLFGLALELRGRPGYFEVPLTFANAFGVEVLPATASAPRSLARLGAGGEPLGSRRARGGGDSTELRELRDYQSGDSLRRVAWKASARRGRLLVRHYEIEERDSVWFVLDASIELWAGRIGHAPLDLAIDATAMRLRQHLRWGHRVGLEVVGVDADGLTVEVGRGRAHEQTLMEALSRVPGTLAPGRSALGENQIAAQVLEHLRALMPGSARALRVGDTDGIARAARRALPLAPFADVRVPAGSERETTLRTYLAAFGVSPAPRLEPRRAEVDRRIARRVTSLFRGRRRATLVYVVSPVPGEDRVAVLERGLERLPRQRRRSLRWLHVRRDLSVPPLEDAAGRAAWTAAQLREDAERRRGERALSNLGISVEDCGGARAPMPVREAVA